MSIVTYCCWNHGFLFGESVAKKRVIKVFQLLSLVLVLWM
jgi:hypothetical protein